MLPDIRFDHNYEQNCTKFCGSGQFAMIRNGVSFGNDPLIIDPVIQPDIPPDNRLDQHSQNNID